MSEVRVYDLKRHGLRLFVRFDANGMNVDHWFERFDGHLIKRGFGGVLCCKRCGYLPTHFRRFSRCGRLKFRYRLQESYWRLQGWLKNLLRER